MKFTIFTILLTFALLITFTLGSAIPNLNSIPETDDNLPRSPDTKTEFNNNLLGNNLLTHAIISAHKRFTTRKIPGISGNDNCGSSPYEPVCNRAGEMSTNSFLPFVGGLLGMGVLL
jgi:hypothetical protein